MYISSHVTFVQQHKCQRLLAFFYIGFVLSVLGEAEFYRFLRKHTRDYVAQRPTKSTWTRRIEKTGARRLRRNVASSVAHTAKSSTWTRRIASAAVASILAERRSVPRVHDAPLRWSPSGTSRSTRAFASRVSAVVTAQETNQTNKRIKSKFAFAPAQSLNPAAARGYPTARGASRNAPRTRIAPATGSAATAAAARPAWNQRRRNLRRRRRGPPSPRRNTAPRPR